MAGQLHRTAGDARRPRTAHGNLADQAGVGEAGNRDGSATDSAPGAHQRSAWRFAYARVLRGSISYSPRSRDSSPNHSYGTPRIPPLLGFTATRQGPSVCRWAFLCGNAPSRVTASAPRARATRISDAVMPVITRAAGRKRRRASPDLRASATSASAAGWSFPGAVRRISGSGGPIREHEHRFLRDVGGAGATPPPLDHNPDDDGNRRGDGHAK